MRKPCCEGKNKGAWTKQEDEKLTNYIRTHGEGCWRTLPKEAGLQRCGKSCRLRWINYLRPDIKRGNFAQDEEDLIVKLHALLGNRWSLIAGRLPGRTDNEVKNYWNSHIRRKLIKMGIDPNNHRPKTIPGFQNRRLDTISPSKPPIYGDDDDEQVVSDGTSGFINDDEKRLRTNCDINLDLTIAFPSPSPSSSPKYSINGEIKKKELTNKSQYNMNNNKFSTKEVEGESFPTLVLFR